MDWLFFLFLWIQENFLHYERSSFLFCFYFHIPLLRFRNVRLSTSFLLLKIFPRHIPHLSIGITFHFFSSASFFSSGKITYSTILSSFGTSPSFFLIVILSSLYSGLLEFLSDNCSSLIRTLSSIPLTSFCVQIFLCL